MTQKYCPNCRSIIQKPDTSDMLKYARYWRDNKCYVCGTTLRIQEIVQQNNYAHTPPITTRSSNIGGKKKIRWGWITFFAVIVIVIYLISIQKPLNINVSVLKNNDSSVFWITNEESEPIKLVEIELNGEYKLNSFPDSLEAFLLGKGEKYIQPNEKVIFFTEYFHNSDGIKFDSHTTAFTKVSVTAYVGNDLRFFHSEP